VSLHQILVPLAHWLLVEGAALPPWMNPSFFHTTQRRKMNSKKKQW
jgi:hypothetical protein